MTASTPIPGHPDLASLDSPVIPISWVLAALAEAEKIAALYEARKTDLGTDLRRVDVHADGMRESSEFIGEYLFMRLDPAGWEAEQNRRYAAWDAGMGFTREEDQ